MSIIFDQIMPLLEIAAGGPRVELFAGAAAGCARPKHKHGRFRTGGSM